MLSLLTFALTPGVIASPGVPLAAGPVIVPTTAPRQLAKKPGELAQVYSDRGTTSARVL